jgi:hypothetical protein
VPHEIVNIVAPLFPQLRFQVLSPPLELISLRDLPTPVALAWEKPANDAINSVNDVHEYLS